MPEGFESYADNHSARVRGAQNAKGQVSALAKSDPLAFVAQFFAPGMRARRSWSSTEIAREMQVPLPLVVKALHAAREAGQAQLVDGRWTCG